MPVVEPFEQKGAPGGFAGAATGLAVGAVIGAKSSKLTLDTCADAALLIPTAIIAAKDTVANLLFSFDIGYPPLNNVLWPCGPIR